MKADEVLRVRVKEYWWHGTVYDNAYTIALWVMGSTNPIFEVNQEDREDVRVCMKRSFQANNSNPDSRARIKRLVLKYRDQFSPELVADILLS